MSTQEIHLELLIGKQVYSLNGRAVGRLEEVCADLQRGVAYVTEFEVGTYAILERLAAWEIGRTILGLFGSLIKGGYRIKWNQLDFTDPERPKLTCPVSELLPLELD
ncbi:MAG TPA: hypothetical protein VGO56_09475 [Pyrinomonadaceae bacterium]|jgi:sporulation protein YlmC with PRC-barrel domain|nr:hypothetical protein [Pyrinomonadaceae bacterium]